MSSVETGQMSAVETGQMSAAGTGQMFAVETGQMSAAEIIRHISCLNSRHLSCLSRRHRSCLNSRHLSFLNRRSPKPCGLVLWPKPCQNRAETPDRPVPEEARYCTAPLYLCTSAEPRAMVLIPSAQFWLSPIKPVHPKIPILQHAIVSDCAARSSP